MKCLVTGTSGFIGSALVRRLDIEGYEVRGLIRKFRPEHKLKNVEYYLGDITDKTSLRSAVDGVDVIFHCAALIRDFGNWKKFYKINFEGTKNLVLLAKEFEIRRFIYLSHMDYVNVNRMGYYSESKKLAENFLINQYRYNKFPCVIIQPGNVYGPGGAVWVLLPLKAIKKNRITLINNGDGIFLHTYIDNLVDALLKSITSEKAVGKIIEITDGDNDIRWGDYINHLAKMAGRSNIRRNLSMKNALFLSRILNYLYKLFGIKPILSPTAVYIFSNKKKVSIKRAKEILNYDPTVNYKEGLIRVENWLREEGYIN